MKAYIYDDVEGDQRLPHDSGKAVSVEDLAALGVLYYHYDSIDKVNSLALERNYKNRDEVFVSPEKMGSVYEEKVKTFFLEHLHEDEEIRYIRGGQGYFDVRNCGNEWVRILLEKDDLIILPAGIYHRFTTDESNYVHAMRLFKDEPKWTALNRDATLENNSFRQGYVKEFLVTTK
ncbi:1,2-dihydroxy-3-keto-5-methylthiopentene dioxygenase [Ceratocystis pirilliformis]|uniref:Acireductone dioxygenase n=1 Tax=Ceratocystis pirilliformis TaxID=259994 RepID=A0ABR3Z7X5_9PEZI